MLMDAPVTQHVASKGLTQDVMVLTRSEEMMKEENLSNGTWTDEYIQQTITFLKQLEDNSTSSFYKIELDGVFHANFTDLPLISPVLMKVLNIIGEKDYQQAFNEINEYTVKFFNDSLK